MSSKSYNSLTFRNSRGFLRLVFFDKCCICNKESNLIEVHHIDKNIKNNDIFNLMPLCLSCHKIAHKSSIDSSEYRRKLIDNLTIFLGRLINRDSDISNEEDKYLKNIEVTKEVIQPFAHPLSDD